MANISVAAGILCVLQRYKMALSLKDQLQDMQPLIYCDTQREGAWTGTKNTMKKLLETGASHILVLEEDVQACDNFKSVLEAALTANPDNMISIYLPRSMSAKADYARKHNQHWIRSESHTGSQAVVLPRDMAVDFLRWEDKFCLPSMPHEDSRMWGYLNTHAKNLWVTRPSLVQHLGAEISALGFNSKGKVSADFLNDTKETSVDWTQFPDKTWPDDHFYEKYFTHENFRGKILRGSNV